MVLRDRDADGNAGTGSYGQASSGLDERLYAQQDANHSVTALVDASGVVVQRFLYDAYGASTIVNGSWASTVNPDAGWTYRFQGTRYEQPTGLHDVRNRFYSPALMRWMQPDPAGYVDGLNHYNYVGDSPVGAVDPWGLQRNPSTRPTTAPNGGDGTAKNVTFGGVVEHTHENLQDLQRAARGGPETGGKTNWVLDKVSYDLIKEGDKCRLVITNIYWHIDLHLPTQKAIDERYPELKGAGYGPYADYLRMSNHEFYDKSPFRTADGIAVHERVHVEQLKKQIPALLQEYIDGVNKRATRLFNCGKEAERELELARSEKRQKGELGLTGIPFQILKLKPERYPGRAPWRKDQGNEPDAVVAERSFYSRQLLGGRRN